MFLQTVLLKSLVANVAQTKKKKKQGRGDPVFVFIIIAIIKFCGDSRKKREGDRDCTRASGLAPLFGRSREHAAMKTLE